MQRTHYSPLAGHPGRGEMISMLLCRWFWPKMRDLVKMFIRNYDVCGRSSVCGEAKAGFLKLLIVPDRIGCEVTINFVISLQKSK